MPGNLSGSIQVVSPSANIIYTITGTSGICSNSATKSLAVMPPLAVSVVSSNTILCAGQTVTLMATGADNYTINPGGITSSITPITPTTSTNYTINGSDISGCSGSNSIFITVTTCADISVSENQKNNLIIYPNPSYGYITIETSLKECFIRVFDVIGNETYKSTYSNEKLYTIDTQQWAKGVYFLRADTETGVQLIKKLIIQ